MAKASVGKSNNVAPNNVATVGDLVFPVVSSVQKVRVHAKELAAIFGLTLRDDGAIGWELTSGEWVFASLDNVAEWSHSDSSANRNNRPVAVNHAIELARLMSDGEYYRDAGLNLIFAGGLLCNGQHTTTALVHVLNSRFPDFPSFEKASLQDLTCPDEIASDGIDFILVPDCDEILVDILDTAKTRTPKDALSRRHILGKDAKSADTASFASAVRFLTMRYQHGKATLAAKLKVGTAATIKSLDDPRFASLSAIVNAVSAKNAKFTYDEESGEEKEVKGTRGFLTRKTSKTKTGEKIGYGLPLAYYAYAGAVLVNGEVCGVDDFAELLNGVAFNNSEDVPTSVICLRNYMLKFGTSHVTSDEQKWNAVRAILLVAEDVFGESSDPEFDLQKRLKETAFVAVGKQKIRNLHWQGGSDVLDDEAEPAEPVDPATGNDSEAV